MWRRQWAPWRGAALRRMTRKRSHDTPLTSFTPFTEGHDSHQHLSLPTPISWCRGLCHMTLRHGQVRAGHVTQGTLWCQLHQYHASRWPVKRHLHHHPTPSVPRRDKHKTRGAIGLTGIKPQLPYLFVFHRRRTRWEKEGSVLVGSPIKASVLEWNTETQLNSLVWLMVNSIKIQFPWRLRLSRKLKFTVLMAAAVIMETLWLCHYNLLWIIEARRFNPCL